MSALDKFISQFISQIRNQSEKAPVRSMKLARLTYPAQLLSEIETTIPSGVFANEVVHSEEVKTAQKDHLILDILSSKNHSIKINVINKHSLKILQKQFVIIQEELNESVQGSIISSIPSPLETLEGATLTKAISLIQPEEMEVIVKNGKLLLTQAIASKNAA